VGDTVREEKDVLKDFYRAKYEEDVTLCLSYIAVSKRPKTTASLMVQTGLELMKLNECEDYAKMEEFAKEAGYKRKYDVMEKPPEEGKPGLYVWRTKEDVWLTTVFKKGGTSTLYVRSSDKPSKMSSVFGKAMFTAGVMWLLYDGDLSRVGTKMKRVEKGFRLKDEWKRLLKLKGLKRRNRSRISPEE
jgi:hypothetical protein